MTLFRDVNSPRMRDLVGDAIVSDPARAGAEHPRVVHVGSGVLVEEPIVSEPVQAVAMNCGPMLCTVDAENAAWRHAFSVIPMHHNADGTVRDCCNDFKYGCELGRQQIVNAILGIPDPDADEVELKADPITAMAHDHLRLAKPNRTRSRG